MTELPIERRAYIGGAWRDADTTFPVLDPATGAVLARVPDVGPQGAREAIDAARAAFGPWRATACTQRADWLRRLHEAMADRSEDLARLLTRENGKPLAEARAEIAYAAGFFAWFAEEARRLRGELLPGPTASRRLLVSREPVGVAALITPWNFPSAMIARKLGAALAAGCTTVIKPAEETPLSAIALVALCHELGLPPGVVNLVTGAPAPIGEVLCADPRVAKLSFTGSTEVGRRLMAACAPTVKRLSLELGGSAPFLVFDDADLDAAAEGAVAAKLRNCGQTCVAASRFLVQEGVAEAFAEALARRLAALRQGPGLEPGVALGPMINAAGRDKVLRLLDDARARGARFHLDGGAGQGLFLPPAVLSGLTDDMGLWREEVFGPVVALRSFTDEAEALRLANDSPWGLAAYVYTRDLNRAWRVSEGLEVGMVGLNTGMISTPMAPFGGVKQSGFGREGSHLGLDDYLQVKTTTVELGPS